MESILSGLAAGIASRVGDGYATDTAQLSSRAVASVYTATPAAMRRELKNNDLLKAVSG